MPQFLPEPLNQSPHREELVEICHIPPNDMPMGAGEGLSGNHLVYYPPPLYCKDPAQTKNLEQS